MAGLTAPAPNTAPDGVSIEADGWFPAIQTDDVRQAIRLGEGTVTDARLRAAVEGAILTGLRNLSVWRTARALGGANELADVTEETIGGENRAELIWKRIVRFFAAAELADGHIDVTATDEALDREEEKRDTADTYRRRANEAVADLRAIGAVTDADRNAAQRNRVDLI